MPSTPRVLHPYPNKNQRDWFSAFESFAASLDASDYAARDDRNIVVIGGDPIAVDGNGNVTWSEDITVLHPSTGYSGKISSAQSGFEVSDGEMVYVDLVRAPTGNYDLQLQSTRSKIPNSDNAFILFFRSDDEVWIRDRGVVQLGQTFGGSGDLRIPIQIALNESQGEGDRVLGRARVDPNDYNYAGGTVSLVWYTEAQVTEADLGGQVKLYDVTGGDTLLFVHDFTDLDPVEFSDQLDLSSVTGRRTYEIRGGLFTSAQPQIVNVTVEQAEDGVTYRFTYNGTDYDYIASGGDTVNNIATGLAAQIDVDVDLTATATNEVIEVEGPAGSGFTYALNVVNNSSGTVGDYLTGEETQDHSVGPPYTDDQSLITWYGNIDVIVSL